MQVRHPFPSSRPRASRLETKSAVPCEKNAGDTAARTLAMARTRCLQDGKARVAEVNARRRANPKSIDAGFLRGKAHFRLTALNFAS